MKEYTTFTTYTGSATKEVQYISLENCKTENERSLFEIYDYYVGILNSPYNTTEIRESTNNIRNEAASILNSRLQGEELATLQAKFLSRFFEFYKIGNIKYPTKFWAFVEAQQVGVLDDSQTYYILTESEGKICGLVVKIEKDEDKHIETLREIHTDLLAGKFGNGTFVQ